MTGGANSGESVYALIDVVFIVNATFTLADSERNQAKPNTGSIGTQTTGCIVNCTMRSAQQILSFVAEELVSIPIESKSDVRTGIEITQSFTFEADYKG